MPGVRDVSGPSYISAHSADVILSDIRPIKLKVEALRAINTLLDEFLNKILSTSCSLATDKLRASLLSLLPTSLGKEALLEAEVELRAYWERTESKASVEDDTRTFHIEWALALLRLKCEAYSTLNEEDEDPASETRINEQFSKSHPHAPSAGLLDPAALYLTAILESMCEHILSNVGRVAARDSSRTSATVNDLFVALCEDDSIYGLFRTMKVYEQIELMSKTPKTRRSKSFTRNDRMSTSRTSSPQNDLTLVNSSGSRSRQSSDGQSATPIPPSTTGSRTSFEKARAIRMFSNGKALGEGDSHLGHKKSESVKSESTRPLHDDDILSPAEDAAMLREFDDLMRSTSTMKVSLTPDRLKTMEVYKQEKDQRAIRRPGTHFSSNSEPDIPRPNSQRPPVRPVDSIVEDEEEQNLKGRSRQASISTPPAAAFAGVVPLRSRSVSTSGGPVRKPSGGPQAAPSSFNHTIPSPDMVQSRDFRHPKVPDNNGFPPRTRKKQHNRDSMDLDDIMNGSDGDQEVSIPVHQQPRAPPTPRRAKAPHAVSAGTRELMDFLAEGPPLAPASKNGEFIDFLANGPPDYDSNAVPLDTSKPKGAGRLQRMISKLNLGNGEKVKGVSDGPKTPQKQQSSTPNRPNNVIQPKPSVGTLSSLANRPIPPRPPRPISPPSSPHDSSDENKSLRSSSRKPYQDTSYSRDASSIDRSISERPSPVIPVPPVPRSPPSKVDNYAKSSSPLPPSPLPYSPLSPNHINGNGNARNDKVPKDVLVDVRPIVPVRTTSTASSARKPVPALVTAAPSIAESDVRDMQRLLSSATTADECRLIFDMYMARNGISREPKAPVVPYPSPSPSVIKHTPYTGGEASLESSLVELFLGGSAALELASQLPLAQETLETDGMPVENDVSGVGIPQNSDIPPGVSIIQNHQVIPVQT
ncbi:hypothetical protein GALMADRAFT_696063 [Galerina marginata CBS 339.88]|uniref:Uncharacterized protein n=1 Tax=Galerina marginata (strain CBS 339.88) TaxID=685588 RepID=A0A067TP27_GALM3|nr:hypothetical protein GALMADRAFT_696063 [Galerina marginata CBS 339.88]